MSHRLAAHAARAMQRYTVYAPDGSSRVTELNAAGAERFGAMAGWAVEWLGPSRVTVVEES